MSRPVTMTINGQKIGPIQVPNGLMLIEFLHEYLNLTGTKFGCGAGVCHACTILVDKPDGTTDVVRSCINAVERFDGQNIRTIEGHAKRNDDNEIVEFSAVQQAFLEHFSFQCGWCTSGFVNEATALVERLQKNPIPESDVETVIEEALGDHVCRCTGYVKYYSAVKDVILNTKGLTYA